MGKGCRRGACAPLGPGITADAEGQNHCTLHLRAFLALAREASRRPGGERSGPGRRILFFFLLHPQLPQKLSGALK